MSRRVDFPLTRAFYVFGVLQGEKLLNENIQDLDEIEEICVRIAEDWENGVDIRNEEENGYPTAYAERVLLEKFGR